MKYLVVGLGNIGTEYELTRHNIGFLVADELVKSKEVSFVPDRYAFKAEFKEKGRQVHVIKPTTYMNLSGKAVAYWLSALKIPLEHMIVVTDELALPFGKIRIKPRGSAGGHNGLGNIEQTINTQEFVRLRFGIGSDFPKGRQVDYVLSQFSEEEFKLLPEKIETASKAIAAFVFEGLDRAMNKYN